jgi:uncharacterized membrane protein
MNFRTSKNLGCIGALIIAIGTILVGVITLYTGINSYNILGVASLLVILISLHSLSNFYKAKNIFTNASIGVIVAIIGFIVISAFSAISPVISDLRTLFLFLCVITGFATIASIFAKRSLNELATRSGIGEFTTAGKLLFNGAILSIVGIGVLLMWIAFISLAIAFFHMKEPKPTLPSTEASTLTTQLCQTEIETNDSAKFCSNCGAHTSSNTIFCTRCGKQLETKS